MTDPGLTLTYKFGVQGAVGPGIGPGGPAEKFELKKWYHITGVKKGAELIIYINGKEENRYNVKRDFAQGKRHRRIADPSRFFCDG